MFNISLTNTLTRHKEVFKPIDATNVRMYACGPTVYDRAHLGNARAAVVYDLLFRLLKLKYNNVTYVRNITDVDDKIIAAAQTSNRSISEITSHFTTCYHDDMDFLNCLRPTYEPRATEFIQQMIDMIEHLIKTGHAYIANNHVLFAVNSYPQYGALARRSQDEMIAGSRIEIAPYKKNPMDFILWKPSQDKDLGAAFDSPWGLGRPGWHIECSAMSGALLGDVFDIHGGGADLMFPHHENEVAQSCAAHGNSSFANYWVHNGFLMVNGEKMSKSLGNFKTVNDLRQQGIKGSTIRALYLSTHYRKPLDFTDKSLGDAEKFISTLEELDITNIPYQQQDLIIAAEILANDLNTPALLAYIHENIKSARQGDARAIGKIQAALALVGLSISRQEVIIPQEIIDLAELRIKLKLEKNWEKADEIRTQLLDKGYTIIDKSASQYEIKRSF